MNNANTRVNSAWSKSNALYAKAASVIGVGYTEMMVLYALVTEGEITQKQISENFGMQKQTVNGMVKELIKKGYLRLDASLKDKREKIIIFTDEGRDYADKIVGPVLKAEDKIYDLIGEDKIKALYETLDLFNLLFERELDRGLDDER